MSDWRRDAASLDLKRVEFVKAAIAGLFAAGWLPHPEVKAESSRCMARDVVRFADDVLVAMYGREEA